MTEPQGQATRSGNDLPRLQMQQFLTRLHARVYGGERGHGLRPTLCLVHPALEYHLYLYSYATPGCGVWFDEKDGYLKVLGIRTLTALDVPEWDARLYRDFEPRYFEPT